MQFSSQYILPIFGIGILFFLARSFSTEFLSSIAYDELTYLIYLPAGIRLLAVTIYDWIGILGIILGWVFCHFYNHEKTLLQCLELGFISGVTAYTSLKIWEGYYKIDNYLEGLTTRLAISLAIISAIISAFIRYVIRYSVDPQTSFFAVFSIGLIGDLLGSLIVIYFIKGGLYFYRQFSKN